MLGVVLWSDSDENKAVIWCEDHGDLAYFNGGSDAPLDLVDFDAGDLVQFDLSQERHLRYARNPRRIQQSAYPGIAGGLMQDARPKAHDAIPTSTDSATILPFVTARDRRREECVPA